MQGLYGIMQLLHNSTLCYCIKYNDSVVYLDALGWMKMFVWLSCLFLCCHWCNDIWDTNMRHEAYIRVSNHFQSNNNNNKSSSKNIAMRCECTAQWQWQMKCFMLAWVMMCLSITPLVKISVEVTASGETGVVGECDYLMCVYTQCSWSDFEKGTALKTIWIDVLNNSGIEEYAQQAHKGCVSII